MARSLAVLSAALLGVGCGPTAGFEPIEPTVLPAVDCTAETIPGFVGPLRARLVAPDGTGDRGETINLSTRPSEFVTVVRQESVEAVNVPSGGGWDAVVNRGEIWARFSGRVDVESTPPPDTLETDGDGALQPWVHVDLAGICESGIDFTEAVVTFTSEDDAVDAVLQFGSGS